MKAISYITITDDKGRPVHDTADEVISLEHMQLRTEGKPVPLEAYPVLTTDYLIKRMIDLSTYRTRSEQRKADELFDKITVTEKDGVKYIMLEDGELEFLNRLRDKFVPYLNGRLFSPFHEVMENPITITV